MKVRIISDACYRFEWMVIVGGTQQEAIDYYAKRADVETWKINDREADAHFAAYRPLKLGLFWFKSRKSFKEHSVHEAFHGVMYLFDSFGLKGPTEETEEIFAYYLDWITREIKKCL